MRIGLTFSLRSSAALLNAGERSPIADAAPDDLEEEFDSPETVQALGAALRSLGHEVELIGDGEAALRRLLDPPRPDIVFNFSEGRGSGRCREARVPAVLEMLDIPYTGSDPLALAVTLDKDCSKRLVQAAGIATPRWVLVEDDPAAHESRLLQLTPPLIVKPAYEGSSKGIRSTSLIESQSRGPLLAEITRLLDVYHQPVLVEEFIVGDELTVGLIGNHDPDVLGIMRIVPRRPTERFVYNLDVKRDFRRQVDYQCPAQISPVDADAVRQAAQGAFRALSCRDLARVDFRLRDHVPYFLEINPLPGLSPTSSDLVIMAELIGQSHAELVAQILSASLERHARALPATVCPA